MSDEEKRDYSSAEELRKILTYITDPKKGGSSRLGEFLADYFGLPKSQESSIEALLHFLDLIDRVVRETEALELDDRYKEQIVSDARYFRDRIFALGTHADLQTVSSNVERSRVDSLKYVEMVLSGSFSYPDMDAEAKLLLDAFEEQMSAVMESSLPPDLKHSLTEGINDLAQSVRNYRIWGTRDTEKKLFAVAGEFAVNASVDENIKQDPVSKGLLKTLGQTFEFLGKARKASDDTSKLISAGQKLYNSIPDVF